MRMIENMILKSYLNNSLTCHKPGRFVSSIQIILRDKLEPQVSQKFLARHTFLVAYDVALFS